jgi:hypothetical protein
MQHSFTWEASSHSDGLEITAFYETWRCQVKVFGIVTPCSHPEDGGSIDLRNVVSYQKTSIWNITAVKTSELGTWWFVTVFTRARHWSLAWAIWIQFTLSLLVSLKPILILSSYLRLGLPSGLFPLGYPTKIQYAFFISSVCATWLAALISLHLITVPIFVEANRLWISSFCSLF